MPGTLRSIAFTPEPGDVVAAFRLAVRPRPRRVAISLGWAAVLELALLFSWAGVPSPGLAVAACLMWPVAAWAGLRCQRLLVSRWARRHFAQSRAMQERWQVWWSDECLTMATTRGQSVQPWREYRCRREDAGTILLYLTDSQYQMLPRRSLTPEDMATLRPLLDRVPPDRLAPAWVG